MVSKVAELEVSVKGSTSALDRDLARTRSHLENFDRTATGATKRVAANITALVGSVRLLAGAAGFGALALAAGKAVQEFAEAEREMLTLQAVIAATGGAAGRGADEINAMAESIANASLLTDNSVRQAAGQLLTFKSVATDVFDRAMQASADLAAVGFGSVQSAAVALGIALENPMEGLSRLTRVGVTFTSAQKEVIRTLMETGRTAEAQRVILKAIEDQVGGAAGAQAGGLSGSFHKLKEAMGSFLEIVGGGIAEVTGLSNTMASFAKVLNDINRQLAPKGMADAIANQEEALKSMREEARRLFLGLNDMGKQWHELRSQKDWSGIAALEETITNVHRALDRLTEKVLDASTKLQMLEIGQAFDLSAKSADAAISKQQQLEDKVAGVTAEYRRQLELLRMPELQRQQTEAVRKAGVEGLPAGEPITALVAQIYNYNQGIENAKAGLESFLSMSEGQRTLFQEMNMMWMTHAEVVEEANRRMQAANIATAERKRRLDQITQQGNLRFEQQTLQVASTAARVLTELFPKQKNAAIASAIINTAVGVTEAMKLMFPLNWIQAGLVAASGAAQIAAIRSTSLSGGGGLPSVSGGGGGAGIGASAEPQAPPQAEPMQGINLQIRGADIFTGNMLAELIESLNDQTRNGKVLIATELIR